MHSIFLRDSIAWTRVVLWPPSGVLRPSLPGMESREMSILAPVLSWMLLSRRPAANTLRHVLLYVWPDKFTCLANQSRNQLCLGESGTAAVYFR